MRPYLFVALVFVLAAGCGSGNRSGLYIALGDSLSAGVGATDPETTAFVPLVHEGLGEGLELMNLGHSGDTSGELIEHGHLEEAVAEVERRNNDGDGDNDVKLVTLEIGGNDLLDIYFTLVVGGTCPALQESLEIPECVDALRRTLDQFEPNLAEALDRLLAADPDLAIAVMTLYNPFSGRIEIVAEMAEVALEGQAEGPFREGLNDVIRRVARERGLVLVDWQPLFEGKGSEYVGEDFIHPNDTGHGVMAEAVLEAVR